MKRWPNLKRNRLVEMIEELAGTAACCQLHEGCTERRPALVEIRPGDQRWFCATHLLVLASYEHGFTPTRPLRGLDLLAECGDCSNAVPHSDLLSHRWAHVDRLRRWTLGEDVGPGRLVLVTIPSEVTP